MVALLGWVDLDAFEMLRGTTSLPFRAGKERRVAVKVIDFRGSEVNLHSGVAHSFIPDCLVDVAAPGREDGVEHLVVEVKDLEREQDRSKDVGAARWIAAVSHWDRLGRWRYAKLNAPHDLMRVLEVSAEA